MTDTIFFQSFTLSLQTDTRNYTGWQFPLKNESYNMRYFYLCWQEDQNTSVSQKQSGRRGYAQQAVQNHLHPKAKRAISNENKRKLTKGYMVTRKTGGEIPELTDFKRTEWGQGHLVILIFVIIRAVICLHSTFSMCDVPSKTATVHIK